MNNRVELPLLEPLYQTYHNQGPATAVLAENPSIRNWYLNQVMNLMCNTKFLQGFTSPEINVLHSNWSASPHLERHWFNIRFARGHINSIIRELLDAGYYATFTRIDDYYVQGKTWYKERHFPHDGMICGYDRKEKTYCIYAYDSNWVYRKFWTPQRSFNAGRLALEKESNFGVVCGIKPKTQKVLFLPETVCEHLLIYLDSHIGTNPVSGEETVYGIRVHRYIAEYVEKLMDGSVPYEKMDRRVFRLIWEHKKVMLERILKIEQDLMWNSHLSDKYRPLVASADFMRVLYASHRMRRRDSVLPVIRDRLLALEEQEEQILTAFAKRLELEVGA